MSFLALIPREKVTIHDFLTKLDESKLIDIGLVLVFYTLRLRLDP